MPEASTSSKFSSLDQGIDEWGSRIAQGHVLHDAISGYLGGAVGIMAANALDLLKVREQVVSTHGPLPAPSSKAVHTQSGHERMRISEGIISGLRTLYRKEGWRVFFAGTLAPVATYAVMDAAFFSIWGRVMDRGRQNREDPDSLAVSALAGALAGGLCATLQTPIEVVKVRAQMERQTAGRKGTIGITQHLFQKEGIRGFFVGLWPTVLRDTFANAIFFPCYHAMRRVLRGENPVYTRREALDSADRGRKTFFRVASLDEANHMNAAELSRIAAAAGIAGAACMIATYPLDVIKTQAQQSVKANAAGERLDISMRGLTTRIWRDGQAAAARDPTFAKRSSLAKTLIRSRGLTRGFKLGVATSALQSAIILPLFEIGTATLPAMGF